VPGSATEPTGTNVMRLANSMFLRPRQLTVISRARGASVKSVRWKSSDRAARDVAYAAGIRRRSAGKVVLLIRRLARLDMSGFG
jgi:hypothetical protein